MQDRRTLLSLYVKYTTLVSPLLHHVSGLLVPREHTKEGLTCVHPLVVRFENLSQTSKKHNSNLRSAPNDRQGAQVLPRRRTVSLASASGRATAACQRTPCLPTPAAPLQAPDPIEHLSSLPIFFFAVRPLLVVPLTFPRTTQATSQRTQVFRSNRAASHSPPQREYPNRVSSAIALVPSHPKLPSPPSAAVDGRENLPRTFPSPPPPCPGSSFPGRFSWPNVQRSLSPENERDGERGAP